MQIQKKLFFEGLTPPQEGQWGFPQNDWIFNFNEKNKTKCNREVMKCKFKKIFWGVWPHHRGSSGGFPKNY